MAIKLKDGLYKCPFCDFTATSHVNADNHRDTAHDFVIVPLLREDLGRLMQFIITKEEALITPRLYTCLRNAQKFQSTQKDM